jgi:hypothetical protein
MIDLQTKVFQKLFINDGQFLDGITKSTTYDAINILDGTISTKTVEISAKKLIKFCALSKIQDGYASLNQQ